ncbi:MAG TPA: glycosyltransferase family 4 protein [Spirochaetota bacterium]|nr:glycosyltransferase family 4 protein [Spirochaetota bacterium]HRT76517.1 glycosyltransferase family 4 protein [Spirochaetota bacterium]
MNAGRPLKICLLCYRGNPYSGGQGIYLKYIADEMVRQGHEVHAIVGPPYPFPMKGVVLHTIHNNQYFIRKKFDIIEPDDPFAILRPVNFYEYLASRTGAFSEISTFGWRAYLLLRKLHEEHGFDVIHDNQSVGYGLLMMKYFGIPVIATIHHPLSIDLVNVLERTQKFKNKAKTVMFYPTLMQSIVARRLDHIITVSEDSKKMIRRDFGVPLEKQTVVYNGIDRSVFRPLPGVKKKKGNIIFVGNVEDGKKGFAYLLKAMPRIDRRVTVTAVEGGAPHHKVTDRLMEKFGLEGRVRFTGKTTTEDLVRLYSESELAIVPSVYEGFGLPAAEAMACGVPVVSSDGGALPEVVGDAGVVVPARDESALADAVNALIADPRRMHVLGEAGIERVKKHFNWEKAVHEIVAVYRHFL